MAHYKQIILCRQYARRMIATICASICTRNWSYGEKTKSQPASQPECVTKYIKRIFSVIIFNNAVFVSMFFMHPLCVCVCEQARARSDRWLQSAHYAYPLTHGSIGWWTCECTANSITQQTTHKHTEYVEMCIFCYSPFIWLNRDVRLLLVKHRSTWTAVATDINSRPNIECV